MRRGANATTRRGAREVTGSTGWPSSTHTSTPLGPGPEPARPPRAAEAVATTVALAPARRASELVNRTGAASEEGTRDRTDRIRLPGDLVAAALRLRRGT